jgi:hypothetical protein
VPRLTSPACALVPCRPDSTDQYALPAVETVAAAAAGAQRGCAVRVADNRTLVPTLRQDADVFTQQPLLVIVPFNVSLGLGPGAIQVNRYVNAHTPLWSCSCTAEDWSCVLRCTAGRGRWCHVSREQESRVATASHIITHRPFVASDVYACCGRLR